MHPLTSSLYEVAPTPTVEQHQVPLHLPTQTWPHRGVLLLPAAIAALAAGCFGGSLCWRRVYLPVDNSVLPTELPVLPERLT